MILPPHFCLLQSSYAEEYICWEASSTSYATWGSQSLLRTSKFVRKQYFCVFFYSKNISLNANLLLNCYNKPTYWLLSGCLFVTFTINIFTLTFNSSDWFWTSFLKVIFLQNLWPSLTKLIMIVSQRNLLIKDGPAPTMQYSLFVQYIVAFRLNESRRQHLYARNALPNATLFGSNPATVVADL